MPKQIVPPAGSKADRVVQSFSGSIGGGVQIRTQTPQDEEWVEELHARVFGPGRFARTAFRVRETRPLDPGLCLVGLVGGRRVGSVWMTPIVLGDLHGHLLGPLATDPVFRGRGVGRALVRTVRDRALEKDGAVFVLLVGDVSYYGPLGFEATRPGAVVFPGPVDPGRILASCVKNVRADSLRGVI